MNIYYLNKNPTACAKDHCDQHIDRVVEDYARLLSVAHRVLDGIHMKDQFNRTIVDGFLRDFPMNIKLYKKMDEQHPCATWVRRSSRHYRWLYFLLEACLEEYTQRFRKKHTVESKMPYLVRLPKRIPKGGFKPPPQNIPKDCQGKNTIASYKRYYIKHTLKSATWKHTKPQWLNQEV